MADRDSGKPKLDHEHGQSQVETKPKTSQNQAKTLGARRRIFPSGRFQKNGEKYFLSFCDKWGGWHADCRPEKIFSVDGIDSLVVVGESPPGLEIFSAIHRQAKEIWTCVTN
jgi:hypothetical protein